MITTSPLLFLILVPIISALSIMAGSKPRFTAILGASVSLMFVCVLLAKYDQAIGGYQFVSSQTVFHALGISFKLGADGLSLIMLALSAIVTLAAVLVARTPEKSPQWFYASLMLISAGVIGAFSSVDLFFFYMFHELALIPTFLLIGIWGSGDRQTAAWKATVYLAVGSFVLMLGLIGLYIIQPAGSRSFDLIKIVNLAAAGQIQNAGWVYLLLLFGFGVLVSLFPFHTWAPQAYASAPSPAAMLHAGVLKKFGLYGLIRIAVPILPDAVRQYSNLLLVLVVGNILYVGYVTISQRKLDWMVGYSSVMHMGYIFLGFAALNSVSLTGASLMLFAHGLSVAVLFALCGELRARTGTLDISELGGLARAMPAFGLFFGLASMAAIGIPGFVGFIGELCIFFGSFSAGQGPALHDAGHHVFTMGSYQIVTVIAVWGVVISAVYMLRAYRRVFLGAMNERWAKLPDLAGSPRVVLTAVLTVMLVTGFLPTLLMKLIQSAILP